MCNCCTQYLTEWHCDSWFHAAWRVSWMMLLRECGLMKVAALAAIFITSHSMQPNSFSALSWRS